MSSDSLRLITEKTHGVKLCLAYATKDNFTGKQIYKEPICALHPDAEACLIKAVAHAKRAGYTLLVYDAFRPRQAQQRLWEFLPDPRYVTSPEQGSAHTRGVAIDVGLMDEAGNIVDMGTGFDDMSTLSHTDCPDLSPEIIRHRAILLGIMLHAGFSEIKYEWWHYQLPRAFDYPMLESDLIEVL